MAKPDTELELAVVKDQFDTFARSINLLLVAHGAGLMNLLPDYLLRVRRRLNLPPCSFDPVISVAIQNSPLCPFRVARQLARLDRGGDDIRVNSKSVGRLCRTASPWKNATRSRSRHRLDPILVRGTCDLSATWPGLRMQSDCTYESNSVIRNSNPCLSRHGRGR